MYKGVPDAMTRSGTGLDGDFTDNKLKLRVHVMLDKVRGVCAKQVYYLMAIMMYTPNPIIRMGRLKSIVHCDLSCLDLDRRLYRITIVQTECIPVESGVLKCNRRTHRLQPAR